VVASGAGVYADQCAGCHMAHGEGIANVFPPLKGNGVVQADDPETLLHLVLTGEKSPATKGHPAAFAMPAFDWKLRDDEIADLATYLRGAWGNDAAPVAAKTVANLRDKVHHLEQ
jgi:mono/diheme cytochrome c family protein